MLAIRSIAASVILSMTAGGMVQAAAPSTASLCRTVQGVEPPAADRPGPAQMGSLKGCNSERLYYGQGVAQDFGKARRCAFTDRPEPQGSPTIKLFTGPTVLMQIYANGLGVKRNLDVATAYACKIDGAPAEVDLRVQHLNAMRGQAAPKRFDYCDDITSGFAQGFCAARDADGAMYARAGRTARLEASLPPSARPAFEALKAASDRFVKADGDGEVDLSGTARAAFVIAQEEAARDLFLTRIEQLLQGRWPAAGAAQARVADEALNATYRRALAFLPSKDNVSTVKAADVRTAQRAWLAYRDVFVAFAKVAAPKTTGEAIAARLSRDRTKTLADLAAD